MALEVSTSSFSTQSNQLFLVSDHVIIVKVDYIRITEELKPQTRQGSSLILGINQVEITALINGSNNFTEYGNDYFVNLS